jgi:hypothetical protein
LGTDNSSSRHFAWRMSEVKDLISLVDARLLECLNQDDEHTIQHCIAQVTPISHALFWFFLVFPALGWPSNKQTFPAHGGGTRAAKRSPAFANRSPKGSNQFPLPWHTLLLPLGPPFFHILGIL